MRVLKTMTNVWLFISFLLTITVANAFQISQDWENTNYDRVVDLMKSYAKERHEITAQNIALNPVSKYYFAVPTSIVDDISLFVPILTSPKSQQPLLQARLVQEQFKDPNFSFYEIDLPYPIAPKSSIQLAISYIYTNSLRPVPEKNAMGAEQTLLLEAPKLPLSPYDTTEYTLRFVGIESHKELPMKFQGSEDLPAFEGKVQKDTLTYGPFKYRFKAYSNLPIALLYAKQIPLAYVYNLQRQFWVSHWSNTLQQEEKIDLSNKAVQLDSGFSRVDWYNGRYMMKQSSVISGIPVGLPKNGEPTDIYYTDLVGNVSTSAFFRGELLLRPRFPVFGGWHFNFTLGWTNMLSDFTRQSPEGEYILKVPVLNNIQDVTYENVDLEFYLPEGAEVVDVQSPFEYNSITEKRQFSYLDMTTGHTKVIINYKNLVDELHNLEVMVVYKYTPLDMFRKPLTTAFYVLLALLGLFALRKIDLSIKPKK